jgi:hypothetical protein
MAPWMDKKDLNLLSQIKNQQGTLWILSTMNVLPLLVVDNQTSYGVLLKVWIEMFNYIPSTIELVATNLKHMINRKCANNV